MQRAIRGQPTAPTNLQHQSCASAAVSLEDDGINVLDDRDGGAADNGDSTLVSTRHPRG